ncbi:MAG: hypothetical protein EA423_05775 [Phycisphaerales bacterium]|nr:MAG: hypothetical protein EA423_05775 [Phycisphaerales bacterium]
MRSTSTRVRRFVLPALLAGALLSGAFLAGCHSGPVIADRDSDPYRGPDLRVDSSRDQHQIVMTAPTGGWAITRDLARQDASGFEVFVTITRPNPRFVQTQAITEQRLATGVSSREAMTVYARQVEFDESPAGPYNRVAEATPQE